MKLHGYVMLSNIEPHDKPTALMTPITEKKM